MIKRITRIQNIGKFIEFSAPVGADFARLTTIYGENGQGKTTLAALMRSLKTGEGAYIRERRSLGYIGVSEAEVTCESERVVFRDYRWNAILPQLEIFDTVFIHENLFAGDSIKTEQQRNLYHFALGKESVYFAKSIAQVDDASRAVALKIKALKGKIASYICGKMSFDQFLEMEAIIDIDSKIAQAKAQLEAVNEQEVFARRSLFSEARLPELWFDRVEDLLASEMENISAHAESRVKEHIAHMDQLGESWIGQGMHYIKDQNCPFCGQQIEPSSIIFSYRDYFSQAYAQHKLRIAKAAEWMENSLCERNLLFLQQKLQENEHLREFWQKYLPVSFVEVDFDAIRCLWSELHQSLSNALRKKAASPLEKILPDKQLSCKIAEHEAFRKNLDDYNRQLDATNRKISEIKQQLQSIKPALAQYELEALQNAKIRHLPELIKLCDEYRHLRQEKNELDQEKIELRQSLHEHTCREIPKYQQGINDFLKNAGADFQLIKSKASHIGGKPGLAYCLSINEIAVAMKPSTMEPSFKSALSSGDRSVLAFAFFMVNLYHAGDISDRIIILDDPVSNLDLKRSEFVKNTIIDLCRRTKQVILLSHDPYFLKSVARRHSQSNTRSLRIISSTLGNALVSWEFDDNL